MASVTQRALAIEARRLARARERAADWTIELTDDQAHAVMTACRDYMDDPGAALGEAAREVHAMLEAMIFRIIDTTARKRKPRALAPAPECAACGVSLADEPGQSRCESCRAYEHTRRRAGRIGR